MPVTPQTGGTGEPQEPDQDPTPQPHKKRPPREPLSDPVVDFNPTYPSIQQIAERRGYDVFDYDAYPNDSALQSLNPYSFEQQMTRRVSSAWTKYHSLGERLDAVERYSGSALPTEMSLALAQSGLPDMDLGRASFLFSRQLSTPLAQLFPSETRGGSSVFLNPVTGKPLSLAAARRLYKPYERKFYEQLITDEDLDPSHVAAWFRALSPIRGDEMPWNTAIGMAISLTKNLPIEIIGKFRSNLSLIAKDPNLTNPITGRVLTEEERVTLSYNVASQNIEFQDGSDVVTYLLGANTGPEPEQGTREHLEWQRRVDLWERWTATSQGAADAVEIAQGEGSQLWDTEFQKQKDFLESQYGSFWTDEEIEKVARENTELYFKGQREMFADEYGGMPVESDGQGGFRLTEYAESLDEDTKLALKIKVGQKGDFKSDYNAMIETVKAAFDKDEADRKGGWAYKYLLHPVGKAFDFSEDVVNTVLYTVGSEVGFAGRALAMPFTGESWDHWMADQQHHMDQARKMMWSEVEGGDDYGLAMALMDDLERSGHGGPGWAILANLTELTAQVALDPTNFVFGIGKFQKAARMAHAAEGVDEALADMAKWEKVMRSMVGGSDTLLAPTYGGRVMEFLSKPLRKLDGETVPYWLIRKAREYKDRPEDFYDALAYKFRSPLGGEGLPRQVVDALHEWVNLADAHKIRNEAELHDDIVDVLMTVHGVKPERMQMNQKLADILEGITQGRVAGLQDRPWAMAYYPPAQHANTPKWQPWMSNERAAKAAEGVASKLWNYWDAKPGAVTSMAIPQVRGYSAGVRTAIHKTMMESWFGPGIRYRRSIIPTMAANLEDDFPGWVENYMNRAKGLFTRGEIAEKYRHAVRIADPFAQGRESHFIRFLESLQEDVITRLGKRYGLSDREILSYLEDTRKRTKDLNRHLYGITDENTDDWNAALAGDWKSVRSPQFVTQLPNVWMTSDPVRFKRLLEEGLGYRQRIEEGVKNIFGRQVSDEVRNALTGNPSKLKPSTVNHLVNSMADRMRTLQSYWKSAIVATPRYLFRVPMGDEQLRFLADAGVLGWMGSRKHVAGIAKRLPGNGRDYIEYDVTSTEFLTRLNKSASEAGFQDLRDAIEAQALKNQGITGDPQIDLLDSLDPDTRQIVEDTVKAWDELPRDIRRDLSAGGGYDGLYLRNNWINRAALEGTPHKAPSIFLKGDAATDTKGHEYAHHVWGTKVSRGTRRAWNKLWDSQSQNLNGNTRRWLDAYSGEDAPEEFFSEALSVWSKDPERLRRNYPAVSDFFDSHADEFNAGLDAAKAEVGISVVGAPKVRIPTPLAGELLDEDAVNASRATSVFESHEQQARNMLERMRKFSSQNERFWDEILPTDKDYGRALSHVLVNQVGRDPLGGRILRALAQGKDPDTIQKEVVRYLAKDEWGRNVAERLGLKSRAALEDHAEIVERMVRDWTIGGNEGMVHAALKGDGLTIQRLADEAVQMDPEALTAVHGFKAAQVLDRSYPGKFLWDAYTKAIFELPTNKLSRQPFFRHWYTQFREGLLKIAKDQELDMTPELLRKIEAQARVHAIERTKSIMFDFRRESRFGEMLWFVAPFYQPFMEAFQVWGKLLRKNPVFANRARIFLQEAEEKDWIRTDPVTGEKTIPLSGMWGAAPLLNMAYGGFGKNGFGLSGPLNSLNFVFGSTFELPTGSMAGNVPLPVPSLNPVLMVFGQKVAKSDIVPDALKWSMMNWAFQYGSQGDSLGEFGMSLLPTYMQHAIRAVGGGDQSILKSQADDFVRLYEAQGMTPIKLATDDEFAMAMAGRKFKSVDEAQRYLADKAMHQARQLSGWRSVMSMFFPVAPSIKFPTQELELEYRDYIEKFGYDVGRDKFLEKYPEHALITIPTTYWTRPDMTVPLPANRMAETILNQPGVKEFAKENPQWVFAMLPQEVWEQEFDRATFFQQMSDGDRATRGPMGMFAAADEQAGWELYFDAKNNSIAELEGLKAQGLTESDPVYQATQAKYDEQIEAIKVLYPQFREKIEVFDTSNLDPWVEFGVDKALKSDLFKQTNTGQFLVAYRALRNRVMGRMEELGLHTLNTVSAETYGVKQLYENGVDKLITQFGPDAERAYNYFFRKDLQAVQTKGDRLLSELSKDEAGYQKYLDWSTRFNEARKTAANSSSQAAVTEAYLTMRQMTNTAYDLYGKSKQNPQILWWETRTEAEKDAYRESVRSRPYVFMSRFDREVVLGEETTDAAEQAWLDIGRFDALIAEVKEQNPNASTASLYDARDQLARDLAKTNKVFATQLAHANIWGYAYWSDEKLVNEPGREGEAWRTLREATENIQTFVENSGLHGEVDFGLERETYRELKKRLLALVTQLQDYSPAFKSSWERMETASSGPDLLDDFMPDIWFKLGGKN